MKLNTLYIKGLRRIKQVLGRVVPHNTRYKPVGVCRFTPNDSSSEMTNEIQVHSIYTNHTSTLQVSEHLFAACSDYWKPLKSVTTDYLVVEVPGGRIYTDNQNSVAVISRFNRVVDHVSLSLTNGKVTPPDRNNIFDQRYFNEPDYYEGTVFTLLTGGAGLNNISHWFVDVLPRLHLLQESGLYDLVDWFLVPSLRYSYQTETLEMLGIPKEKLIAGDEHPHIAADGIIASTAPRGIHTIVPEWLCQFNRNAFLPLEEVEANEKPLRLYISRSDSAIRNVLNEKELLEALEPLGFRNIISSKYSMLERIKMFSQAEVVIGATGAGLINMLFCKPGTRLIEIFSEGFILEPFYDIAPKIGLDYDYVICKGNNNIKNADHGQREHITVEIDKVLSAIARMEAEKLQSATTKRAEVSEENLI
ncbi:glycosyltransferase family 61 protein [Pontibacter beigongshangensis]|uniref:glycosyltransferase family 61 protein n=1 Tax=Pontibacter beigongshangensis TaxID=2574733 RepID=UPI00164F43A3|nr:glycosyltransferase family 61 protein [Pontibacter beigongshangensis]